LQKKFLRVLQERTVRPLGASKEKSADFRLVAATNRDLDTLVGQGQFRQDLLFRLQSLRIELPPLRDRRGDIRPLAEHYLDELSRRYKREITGVSDDFFPVLQQYDWPGNVRELHQALEKAVIAAGSDGELFSKDLPKNIRAQVAKESIAPETESRGAERAVSRGEAPFGSLKAYRDEVLERAEREYLTNLLLHVKYDINAACAISELSRSRFYSLLKKYGISTQPGD
jgi:two-component system NtrC family response regulator